MLPYDYHRCTPTEPDSFCQQCARYSEHPKQTWGPRTAFMLRKNSTDDNCSYIKEKE